ncbi:MAG: EH signature domain-containing protein [Leptospirales bacterium]
MGLNSITRVQDVTSKNGLGSVLSDILQSFSKSPLVPGVSPMSRVLREIQKSLGYGGTLADVGGPKMIIDSVRQYRNNPVFQSFKEGLKISFGVSLYDEVDGYCLLKDPNADLFSMLLRSVDEYRGNNRQYLRLYRGLLSGYFNYFDKDCFGWYVKGVFPPNWLTLQGYLRERLSPFSTMKDPVSEWVSTLKDNKNLFGENPCDRYGEDLLIGKTERFEQVCLDLQINDRSWVLAELIMGQIRASLKREDRSFVGDIPILLQSLKEHPLFTDEGLRLILTRYGQISGHDHHLELLSFALEQWKNPLLLRNQNNWARVSAQVCEMVKRWIKSQYIEQFFDLLADGAVDKRRHHFWLQYVDHISDMWFALGPNAFASERIELNRIKENMHGRTLRLVGSNSDNNAFMMKIGDYVFVEFGVIGNACHIFKAGYLPFGQGAVAVTGDSSGLKNTSHKGHSGRMDHRADWEIDFADSIKRKTGITPGDKRSSPPNLSPKVPDQTQHSIDRAIILVKQRGLVIQDNRSKGGCVWVKAFDRNDDLNKFLKELGFKYKESRGWWREDQ